MAGSWLVRLLKRLGKQALEVDAFLDFFKIEPVYRAILRSWVCDMCENSIHKLFLINLRVQAEQRGFYFFVFRRFLINMHGYLAAAPTGTPLPHKLLHEQIAHVVDSAVPSTRCRGKRVPKTSSRLSTITDTMSLVAFNVPPWRPVNDGSLFREILDGSFTGADLWGRLRGRRPIRWVTKSDEVNDCLSGEKESRRVAALRNKLGLKHYQRNVLLVEVRYPSSWKGRQVRVPTTLDAGAALVFRPCCHDDGWGRAVNLKWPHRAGLPEAVHDECTIGTGFELTALGEPRQGVPRTGWRRMYRAARESS